MERAAVSICAFKKTKPGGVPGFADNKVVRAKFENFAVAFGLGSRPLLSPQVILAEHLRELGKC